MFCRILILIVNISLVSFFFGKNPIWLSGGLMAVLSHSLGLSKNVLINIYFFYFSSFFWHSKTRIIVRKFDRMHEKLIWEHFSLVCVVIQCYPGPLISLRWRGFDKCRRSLKVLCRSFLNCWNYLSICISIKLSICIDFV